MSVNILIEAKKEYTNQLQKILTPRIYEGFKSIYDDILKLVSQEVEEKQTQSGSITKIFQKTLREIPQWNQEMIKNEFSRIEKVSNCDYIDNLIEAVFITNTKVLTSVQINDDKAQHIKINLPQPSHFIHKCYMECAKEIYKNPYIFDQSKNLTPKEKHNNLRDALILIDNSINNAVRDLLPIRDILMQGLTKNKISHMQKNEIIDDIIDKKEEKNIQNMEIQEEDEKDDEDDEHNIYNGDNEDDEDDEDDEDNEDNEKDEDDEDDNKDNENDEKNLEKSTPIHENDVHSELNNDFNSHINEIILDNNTEVPEIKEIIYNKSGGTSFPNKINTSNKINTINIIKKINVLKDDDNIQDNYDNINDNHDNDDNQNNDDNQSVQEKIEIYKFNKVPKPVVYKYDQEKIMNNINLEMKQLNTPSSPFVKSIKKKNFLKNKFIGFDKNNSFYRKKYEENSANYHSMSDNIKETIKTIENVDVKLSKDIQLTNLSNQTNPLNKTKESINNISKNKILLDKNSSEEVDDEDLDI